MGEFPGDAAGELRRHLHAAALDPSKRQVGATAVAIDGIDGGEGVRIRHARNRGKDLAFPAVREGVEHGHGSGVIAVGGHVGVEEDLHRLGGGKESTTDGTEEYAENEEGAQHREKRERAVGERYG